MRSTLSTFTKHTMDECGSYPEKARLTRIRDMFFDI